MKSIIPQWGLQQFGPIALVVGCAILSVSISVQAADEVDVVVESVVTTMPAQSSSVNSDSAPVQSEPNSESPTSTSTVSDNKTLKSLILDEPGDATVSESQNDAEPSLMQEGLKTVGMLILLLVGFWWFSNYLKKTGRLARMTGSAGGIECLSVYSVGQKEKIALIKVKGQELLVGITQHSITPIHHFKDEVLAKDFRLHKDKPSDTEFAKVMDDLEPGSKT